MAASLKITTKNALVLYFSSRTGHFPFFLLIFPTKKGSRLKMSQEAASMPLIP